MDVREKLVELICDGTQKTEICTTDTYMDCETCRGDCGYCTILADHLMANGVTVQEWISVNDRLPENGRYVVCIAKRNPFSRFMPMVARIEKNGWVNPMTEQYISEVTHWMPMPELPRREDGR